MTNKEINDTRLVEGVEADAWTIGTFDGVLADGSVVKNCYITLVPNKSNPEKSMRLNVSKGVLKTIIGYLKEDLSVM